MRRNPRAGASKYYVLKLAGRCNINCTYCYIFNKGDSSYAERPKFMNRAVASQALQRIFSYARATGLQEVGLVLHGGEPLLIGKAWIRWFADEIAATAPEGLFVRLSVQTNATLIDEEWIDLFRSTSMGVGVSIDGPPEWHDRFRVSHSGSGTYAETRRGIDLLRASDTPFGVLCVASPGYSSSEIYRHFRSLGIRSMDFLWPDFSHDAPPELPPGELAAYFIELFDTWYGDGDGAVSIRWFDSVMMMLLGNDGLIEGIGGGPVSSVVVETDGSLQPLDVLRVCGDGMTEVGMNVRRHGIEDLRRTPLFRSCLTNAEVLPEACLQCPVVEACGGGYLPGRWGLGRGFANRNVHCEDLFKVITHVRGVVAAELRSARDALALAS